MQKVLRFVTLPYQRVTATAVSALALALLCWAAVDLARVAREREARVALFAARCQEACHPLRPVEFEVPNSELLQCWCDSRFTRGLVQP